MFPQTILDSVPVGILITDRALKIKQINRWLALHLGPAADGVVGQPLGEAFPELVEQGRLTAYELVFENRKPFTLRAQLLRLPALSSGADALDMVQSVIIIPLQNRESIIGTLTLIEDITTQVQTEKELNREIARLSALLEIDRVLTTLDLRDCLQIIVERACALFKADNTTLLLFEGEYLRHMAEHGVQPPVADLRFHPNRGLTGWAARHRQSVRVDDVLQDDRYLAVDPRTRSEMVAPLIVHGTCIGVINVESGQLSAFDQSDLDLLESFARRAAIAIHNARLHTAERMQHVLAETLRDAGLALTAELDPDAVLDRLLENVPRVVPYDSASVMLVEGGRVRIKRHYGYDQFGVAHLAEKFDVLLGELDNLRRMAQTRQPAVIPEVRNDPGWVMMEISGHVESWCGAPIIARGQVLGFLSLDKTEPGFYTLELADRLAAFAAQAGLALENARLYAEQQRLAVTDGLTGLPNRRRFDEELNREVQRAQRFRRSVALLILDIDNFKRFNDTYGHLAGDELLRAIAGVLRKNIRAVDTPARYGGEEFAVILPEADLVAAVEVAERLRLNVARQDLVASTLPNYLPITISIGVAIAPAHATAPEALIKIADQALYRAKRAGKNQVAVPMI